MFVDSAGFEEDRVRVCEAGLFDDDDDGDEITESVLVLLSLTFVLELNAVLLLLLLLLLTCCVELVGNDEVRFERLGSLDILSK